jgi:molybdopterin molybdotransferase
MSPAPEPLPTPAEATATILARVPPLPVEMRPLAALTGAVLAQDVHAERDQPPFDRVTMDGVAFASARHAAGVRRFRIAGVQAAGRPPLALPDGDVCIEVMTGAMLPDGCDCVVPVERVTVLEQAVELPDSLAIEPGMNVHPRGLDARAGVWLLGQGTRLGAPELAVLASAGLPHAHVRAEPRIVIVTTGDELVDPGAPIEAWQIRRSNAHALRAALVARGFARTAEDHLPDEPGQMRERLARHLDTHDVLVLTGGVSMGRYDHVPAVLAGLGVQRFLHRIAQRPGLPLWFGIAGRGQAVFGLPGNPVSALVCLVRYVVPALLGASGASASPPEEIRLGAEFQVRPPLTFFLPVRLEAHAGEGSVAVPNPTRGSGDFVSLLGTHGFVELPPGPALYPAGHVAPFYRW